MCKINLEITILHKITIQLYSTTEMILRGEKAMTIPRPNEHRMAMNMYDKHIIFIIFLQRNVYVRHSYTNDW